MQIALGKLGWSEYEYYTSSPEGFYYACKGYFSKMQDESLAIRNLSFIVYRLGGGKGSIESIWPLDGKEKMTISPPTKEWWEKIKKNQIGIDKKIQDARLKNNHRS